MAYGPSVRPVTWLYWYSVSQANQPYHSAADKTPIRITRATCWLAGRSGSRVRCMPHRVRPTPITPTTPKDRKRRDRQSRPANLYIPIPVDTGLQLTEITGAMTVRIMPDGYTAILSTGTYRASPTALWVCRLLDYEERRSPGTAQRGNIMNIMNITSAAASCTLAAAVLMGTAGAAMAAPEDPYIVPFEQATIVDPATVTQVVGKGVFGPDGTNLCAVNPGSIAFPDGTYPCFTGLEGLPGLPTPPQPQVTQMPAGGADTGAKTTEVNRAVASGTTDKTTGQTGTTLALSAAAALLAASTLIALRRRSTHA
jgi:hypothetical protein